MAADGCTENFQGPASFLLLEIFLWVFVSEDLEKNSKSEYPVVFFPSLGSGT